MGKEKIMNNVSFKDTFLAISKYSKFEGFNDDFKRLHMKALYMVPLMEVWDAIDDVVSEGTDDQFYFDE